MKRLLIGLLVLGSFSTFSQNKECVLKNNINFQDLSAKAAVIAINLEDEMSYSEEILKSDSKDLEVNYGKSGASQIWAQAYYHATGGSQSNAIDKLMEVICK